MNQEQYGSIMRELGILAAKVEGLEREEGHMRRAIEEQDKRHDEHMLNDHGHPPYANNRSKPVAVAIVASRYGGPGLLVVALLEMARIFLGG